MNEQANIELIRQVYDAFLNGDSQRLLSYMAQDIDWDEPQVPNLPFAGKRQGRDSVAEFFRMVATAQQLRDFRPGDFIAQGDRVVVTGHYEWTVRANGVDWGSDWVHLFTVRDGKITAFREFTDTHRAVEAFQTGQAGSRNIPVTDSSSPPSIH
ncbi:nuclear transport factor 2 family protein [Massilia sp. GCM10020059]|uniref:Nuclear transport factor 2 family protein n=1 Tax=Massilia agrisoli TaxID=2892444 RepID=A0ABS8IMC2_9BURK|nr:nuclear transport factor 2 family protein [Massilia agrisoli]MCC6069680.1 nuclear transport factor 2 family protein [Massilia agrisoli]